MLALLTLAAAVAAPGGASGPDMSGFASLPEDPPPKELVRGNHYWVSNEERPELFKEDLEKIGGGGVYIGVGAEQNFVFAGWAKPDVLVLMDFDGAIADLHRMYFSVFKRAETKEDFVTALELKNVKTLLSWVNEDWPDKPTLKRVYDAIHEARATCRVHAERIRQGFTDRKIATFLNDDEQYKRVRQLFLDGHVFMVRGDLTAKQTMQAIALASRKAGLPVHAVYLSNAEQYFPYNQDYRSNILALPFDEKSLVIRTISWPKWGFAKDSNSYHYNIQGGLSFQSFVADARTKAVSNVLDAAVDRKGGVSHLFTPPASPDAPAPAATPADAGPTNAGSTAAVAPVPLENAPAVAPCLEGAVVAGMSCIPGGPFIRGTDDKHKVNLSARPQGTVWVQTFYMDVYEATYGEYKECEKAGKCKKAGPNYLDFNNPKQPITGISWYDAKQFCEAHGKRLPTEAEWEHAARGTDGRTYPWGNEPATCDRTVIMIDKGRSCGIPQKSKDHADVGRPEVVGTKPATLYGLYDMAGNSWEWVADWFSEDWEKCGADCAGVNPKGPCGGADPCPGHTEKVVRGGSWYWPAQYATTFHRRPHAATNAPIFHHFGFRCAASLDGAKSLAGGSPGSK